MLIHSLPGFIISMQARVRVTILAMSLPQPVVHTPRLPFIASLELKDDVT